VSGQWKAFSDLWVLPVDGSGTPFFFCRLRSWNNRRNSRRTGVGSRIMPMLPGISRCTSGRFRRLPPLRLDPQAHNGWSRRHERTSFGRTGKFSVFPPRGRSVVRQPAKRFSLLPTLGCGAATRSKTSRRHAEVPGTLMDVAPQTQQGHLHLESDRDGKGVLCSVRWFSSLQSMKRSFAGAFPSSTAR